MLKVMVVDDEALVRIGIKSCIDWEKQQFDFVGEAEDGLQALALMERSHPDIVMTDIMMPNMDGLQLIETINRRYPRIKVIVLSCLNDMDTVKKAIKLGAEDYILKLSMKPQNLLEVLLRTKAVIEEETRRKAEKVNLETVFHSNRQMIKNGLYAKWIEGSLSHQAFLKEYSLIDVQPDFPPYLVVCCTIDDWQNAPLQSRIRDRHLLSSSFVNICMESLKDFTGGEVAELEEGAYLILLQSPYPDRVPDQLTRFFHKMNLSLKRYLNISVSFAVSGLTTSLEKVPVLYAQARDSAEYRFYKGKESIIFADSLTTFKDRDIIMPADEEKLLTQYIYSHDREGVTRILNQLFQTLAASASHHPIRVKTALLNILYSFQKVLAPYEEQLPPAFGAANLKFTQLILNADTLANLQELTLEYVEHYFMSLPAASGLQTRPEIKNIKRYVHENIEQAISLEDAAKYANMSRSYFSYIFKSEVGESFTNFVNRTKMEKARELIAMNNLKVYEAAERVGIKDEAYFSKVFKKYIGVSPGKVKKTFI